MKRSSWIETFLLPVAMAGLIASWLSLWERWFAATAGAPVGPAVPPWLMVITIMIGAFVTRRAMVSVPDNLHLQRAQWIIGLGGLVAVSGVLWITFGPAFPIRYFYNLTEWNRLFSPEAIALVVAGFLWWRSIRIGRDDDLHESAQREFFGGVLALALLFIANKIHPALPADETFWPTMIFFAIGLGAMAVAGLEQDRRIQWDATGSNVGVSRHWLATVGGIIGLILVGGLVVAGVAAPETLDSLNSFLDTVGVIILTIIGFTLYYLVLICLPFIDLLVRAVWPLLQMVLRLSAAAPQLGPGAPTPEQITDAAAQIARTPTFRFIEIVGLLCLAALLFMLAVRRFRLLANVRDADEIRESILSRELVWNQLKTLFARQPPSPSVLDPYLSLSGLADDPRLVVRRAYQTMLGWAEAHQLAREPRQTPAMYAEVLQHAWPLASSAIQTLTVAYERARYGEQVSGEEAGQAQAAVENLQTIKIV